jgi:phosphate transport system regulatory protein PhoU
MVEQIFGVFDLGLAIEMGAQILLALLLGGLVGYERERRRIPAGLRTFMLVSTGACIFTILSLRAFPGGDPARIAAQIVSGIGFLGAGLVLQRKGTIYGLTSAAGIWAIAAVGMAVGAGKYFVAIFGAVAIFVVLGLIRRWFKAEVPRATRRTLNTSLRRVRERIVAMGRLVTRAIQSSVQAAVQGDEELAQETVERDLDVDDLRYRIEEECLDILRAHRPRGPELRTVVAATHVATNLERIGDYAKEIALFSLQAEHEPLRAPLDKVPLMADQVCDLLQQVLTAFGEDDVAAAEQIIEEMTRFDQRYEEIVEAVTDKMSEKKTRHFERGAYLLNLVIHLKRAGERVANIAKRIVFVRTGALAEIDREE